MSAKFFSQSKVSAKRLLLFILSALLFFILFSAVINLVRKYIGLHHRVTELNNDAQNIQQKQAMLDAENAYITTPEGEERALREKYNLVKPGEEVIVVSSPGEKGTTTSLKQHSFFGGIFQTLLKGLGIGN